MFPYVLAHTFDGGETIYHFRSPVELRNIDNAGANELAKALNIDFDPEVESLTLVDDDGEVVDLTMAQAQAVLNAQD